MQFIYMLFLYSYNIVYEHQVPLYSTVCLGWIGFYYLGLERRKIDVSNITSIILIISSFLFEIVESIILESIGCDASFYLSQVRYGGFCYATSIIVFIYIHKSSVTNKTFLNKLLVYLGDNSYILFYSHYLFIIIFNVVYKYLALGESIFLIFLSFLLILILNITSIELYKKIYNIIYTYYSKIA